MADSDIIEVVFDNLEEKIIKANGDIVLFFYEDWSGASRVMHDIFIKIANSDFDAGSTSRGKKSKSIKFCRVNVDQEHDIASIYSVGPTPAFYLLHDGKIIDTKRDGDIITEKALKEWISDVFAKKSGINS
jgi:thioredoxin 1